MRKLAPLVKKELLSYFNSPIAYILVILFLVFTSLWLYALVKGPRIEAMMAARREQGQPQEPGSA